MNSLPCAGAANRQSQIEPVEGCRRGSAPVRDDTQQRFQRICAGGCRFRGAGTAVPANPGGVDQIADRLSGYHLLHATRAQLLTALGDHAAARAANERALALTHNPAEQQLLRARLGSDLLN
ncbi:MAG TPA: hypothetical protein VK499_06330 [Propionibacteriaceae bacterium]|nr:hypothetical protein [Propionibacteriaceae bacterium]